MMLLYLDMQMIKVISPSKCLINTMWSLVLKCPMKDTERFLYSLFFRLDYMIGLFGAHGE